ncbi:MAG: Cna B-type domain-containing protein, partial [Blautia sp.]|nr:Cna B-type domain-containing protein [Blautia sp.]
MSKRRSGFKNVLAMILATTMLIQQTSFVNIAAEEETVSDTVGTGFDESLSGEVAGVLTEGSSSRETEQKEASPVTSGQEPDENADLSAGIGRDAADTNAKAPEYDESDTSDVEEAVLDDGTGSMDETKIDSGDDTDSGEEKSDADDGEKDTDEENHGSADGNGSDEDTEADSDKEKADLLTDEYTEELSSEEELTSGPEYGTEFLYEDDSLRAVITADEAAGIPANAEFHAEAITEGLEILAENIRQDLGYGETTAFSVIPYKFYFTAEGTDEVLEPVNGNVHVELSFTEPIDLGVHELPVKTTMVAHEAVDGFETLDGSSVQYQQDETVLTEDKTREGTAVEDESKKNGSDDAAEDDFTADNADNSIAYDAADNETGDSSVDAEAVTAYRVTVSGMEFDTGSFSTFSGVVEYGAAAKRMLKNVRLLGAGSDQEMKPFASTFEIEGVGTDSEGKYVVVSGKKYKIKIGFMEDPDGDGDTAQYQKGSIMTYEIPNGLTIPNPVTVDNKKTIAVTLEGASTTGSDYEGVTLSWWIEDGNKVRFQWNFRNEEDKAAFDRCYNTYFVLELEGIIKDETERIDWGGKVGTKDFAVDTNRDLNVEKTVGSFDSINNVIHYTVKVTSKGVNTGVVVTDTIAESSREFMEFDTTPSTFEVTGYSESVSGPIKTNSADETGFSKEFPVLDDGQTVTINYVVKLKNMNGLTPQGDGANVSLGTQDQTKNSVSVKSNEVTAGTTLDTEAYIVDKIKVQSLGKRSMGSAIKETETSADGSETKTYDILRWMITLQSRPEDALNMGGKTISDSIAGQVSSLTEYDGDGITVTVKCAKDNTVVKTWDVLFSELPQKSDSSWSYIIPDEAVSIGRRAGEDDGNSFIYEITYKTRTDISSLVEDKTIQNTGSGFGSGTGIGTVGPGEDNRFEIEKEVAGRDTTTNEITWKITIDVPAIGLDGNSILTDTYPTNGSNRDSYVAGSLQIDGLKDGESYTEDSSDPANLKVSFFKDAEKQQLGFQSNDKLRKVVVTFRTKNSTTWTPDSSGNYIHRNDVSFSNDKITRSAYARVVSNPRLKKEMQQVQSAPDGLPMFKCTINIYGTVGQNFQIEDTFDDRLVYVPSSSATDSYGVIDPHAGNDGHVQAAAEGNKVTFTIDPALLRDHYKGNQQSNNIYNYTLTYYIKVKDRDALNEIVNEAMSAPDNTVYLGNNASSTMFGETETTVAYEYSPVTKEWVNQGGVTKTNRTAEFRIEINKEALDLNPNSDTIIVPDAYDSAISVDYNSIRITEGDGADQKVIYYDSSTKTIVKPDGAQSYWDGSGNSIIYTIPDKTHIVITYNGNISGWGAVSAGNTVDVMGYNKGVTVTADFGEKERAGGSAYNLIVKKYVDGDMTHPLEGVKFNLYKGTGADGETPELIQENVETGADGMAYLTGLRRNTYYYFQEVEDSAVHNTYRYDSTKYRFRISADGSTDYTTYTYKTNDVLTVRNETKVISIPVTKVWAGGDPPEGTSVTIKLKANGGDAYQYDESTGLPSTTEKVPDLTITKNAKGSWEGEFTNIPRRDAAGNTITYTIEEVNTPSGYSSDNGKRVDDSRPNRVDKGFIVTNTKETGGTIKVSKTIQDEAASKKKAGESFTVKIKPVNPPEDIDLSSAIVTGTQTHQQGKKEITFTVKHGETVVVTNLPFGTYKVEETASADGSYTTTYLVDNTSSSGQTDLNEAHKTAAVAINNEYVKTEQKLTVKKEIVGGPASAYTKEYKVRIKNADNKYLKKVAGTNGETIIAEAYNAAEAASYEFTVTSAKPLELSVPVGEYTIEEVLTSDESDPSKANDLVNLKKDYDFVGFSVDYGKVKNSAGNDTAEDAANANVPSWAEATATVKNEYRVHTGSLKIKKVIEEIKPNGTDEAPAAQDLLADTTLQNKQFEVLIRNQDDQYLKVNPDGTTELVDDEFPIMVTMGSELVIDNVPVGVREYTIIEKDTGREIANYNFVPGSSTTEVSNVTVEKSTTEDPKTAEVNLTNKYKHKMARISVIKLISLLDGPAGDWFAGQRTEYERALKTEVKNKEFTFEIRRKGSDTVLDTLKVKGDETSKDTSIWLPIGTYVVTEKDPYNNSNDFVFNSVEFSGGSGAAGTDGYEVTLTESIADVADPQPVEVSATNKYDKVRTYVHLNGTKAFTNGDLSYNTFTFSVKDASGNPVMAGDKAVTGRSNANGTITFSPDIGIKSAGTYIYYVTEDMKDGAGDGNNYIGNGIKYDPSTWKVTVVVSGNTIDELTIDSQTYEKGVKSGGSTGMTWSSAEGISFTNDVTETRIMKFKEDTSGPTEMNDATLRITRVDDDGGVIDANGHTSVTATTGTWQEWTTGSSPNENPKVIYGLRAGTYRIEEIVTPKGYRPVNITFTVDKTGVITGWTDHLNNNNAQTNTVVTIDTDTSNAENPIRTLNITDAKIHFKIKKWDPEKKEAIQGAVIDLYEAGSSAATPIYSWTSRTDAASDDIGQYLEVGKRYTLRETTTPTGYKPSTVTFYIDTDGQVIEDSRPILLTFRRDAISNKISYYDIDDLSLHLKLKKTDAITGNSLAGATFVLYDITDKSNVMEVPGGTWTSKVLTGNETFDQDLGPLLDVGHNYKLVETSWPVGYAKMADITFSVSNAGTIYVDNYSIRPDLDWSGNTSGSTSICTAANQPLSLLISKTRADGSTKLAGATMTVYKADDSGQAITTGDDAVIDTWETDGTSVHDIGVGRKLQTGVTYVLQETAAPTGFAYAEDILFRFENDGTLAFIKQSDNSTVATTKEDDKTVYVVKDEPLHFTVTKKLLNGTTLIPGVTLTLYKDSGDGTPGPQVDTWTSSGSSTSKDFGEKLDAGQSYILRETDAPAGYLYTDDIYFSVNKDGSINAPYQKTTNADGSIGTNAVIKTETDTSTDPVTTLYVVEDEKLHLFINKIDADTESQLTGATFDIYDGGISGTKVNGTPVAVDSRTDLGSLLKAGKTYTFVEVTAPQGHAFVENFTITIAGDGTITTALDTQKDEEGETVLVDDQGAVGNGDGYRFETYLVKDKPLHFVMNKKVLAGSDEVAGATLTIYEAGEDGTADTTKTVDTWTSEKDKTHDFGTSLEAGKSYVVKETGAPAGYAYMEDIHFSVEKDGTITAPYQSISGESGSTNLKIKTETITGTTSIVYIAEDKPLHFNVSKTEITTGNEVPGAEFKVYKADASGNAVTTGENAVVDSWTSEMGVVHDCGEFLEAGQGYVLHEELAPAGYQKIVNNMPFSVAEDGTITTALPTKKDESNADILAENGEKIYLVQDTPIHFYLSKIVAGTGDELSGASFALYDVTGVIDGGDGTLVDDSAWTSVENEYKDYGPILKTGHTYTLKETDAPKGYAYHAPVTFTVGDNGTITYTDNALSVKKDAAGQDVTSNDEKVYAVEDTPLHLVVEKVLTISEPGEELTDIPGATIVLYEKGHAGTILDTWNTTEEPQHEFGSCLDAGKTYMLKETVAPKGYAYAVEREFTVRTDGTITTEMPTYTDAGGNDIKTNGLPTYLMEEDSLHFNLNKVNAVTGEEMAGATFAIFDKATGVQAASWEKNGDGSHDFGADLFAGKTYTLKETSAPTGYAFMDDVDFEVGTDGTITWKSGSLDTQKDDEGRIVRDAANGQLVYLAKDEPLHYVINKMIAGSDEELAGATLTLYEAEEGKKTPNLTKEVDSWKSKANETHDFGEKLDAGHAYVLRETSVPTGYGYAPDIYFSVGKDGTIGSPVQVITDTSGTIETKAVRTESVKDAETDAETLVYIVENAPLHLFINKVDEDDESQLTGAAFDVYVKGTATKVNGEKSIAVDGRTDIGSLLDADKSYTIKEVTAPQGYAFVEDVEFTVNHDGSITTDVPIQENEDGDPVLVAADGQMVDENGFATYLIKDAPLHVRVSKVNENDEKLADAVLVIYEADAQGEAKTDKEIARWNSTDMDVHDFGSELYTGVEYILRETIAPQGYGFVEDLSFTIRSDGTVVFDNLNAKTIDGKETFVIEDTPIRFMVNKLDSGTEEEVEGAKLAVYETADDGSADLSKQVGDAWISGKNKTHDFGSDLYADTTYVLHEISAPTGYAYAEDVPFTVKKDGSIETTLASGATEDGTVYLMKDDPVRLSVNKLIEGTEEELDRAVLTVYKVEASDEETTSGTDSDEGEGSGAGNDGTGAGGKDTEGSGTEAENVKETEIVHWTSKKGEIFEFGHLLDTQCSYVIRETEAPTGYAVIPDIRFFVVKDGTITFEEEPASVTKDGKTVYQITDAPLHFYLNKVDLETGEAVPEETTIVIYEEGKTAADAIETWTSTGEKHDFGANLGAGKTYVIEETRVPTGYAFAQTKRFTVNQDGTITVDTDELPVNKDGEKSGEDETDSDGEEEPPLGSGEAEPGEDPGDEQPYAFLLENKPLHLFAKKVDAETGEDVGGATFVLHEKGKEKDEDVLDSWTTVSGEYHDFGSVLDAEKTYVLKETDAPTGYGYTTAKEFTVTKYGEIETNVPVETDEDGEVILDEYGWKNYLIKEDEIHFTINKLDAETGEEVEGATLAVYEAKADGTADTEKQIGESWTSAAKETHDFGGKLDAETRYVLRETSTPTGYAYTADVPFTVNKDGTITFENAPETTTEDGRTVYLIKDKPLHLFAKKVDAETGEDVGGATFVLHEKGKERDEDVLDSWTTVSGEYHDFGSALDAEKTYVLEETDAPTGYGFTTAKEFTVTKYGEIETNVPVETDEDGEIVLDENDCKNYLIEEDEIHFIINKLDAETGEEVEGATLAVYEAKADGTADTTKQVGESWTSAAEEPHDFGSALDAEKRYVLRETFAPTGYACTADVPFTVNKDGTITFENAPETTTEDGRTVYLIKDKPLHLLAKKIDAETGEEVEGATFVLHEKGKEKDEDILDSWTTVSGEYYDFGSVLDTEKTYVLEETDAPTGYGFTTAKEFTVTKYGEIVTDVPAETDEDGAIILDENDCKNYLIEEDEIHFIINKLDAETGEEVEGATLAVFEAKADGTADTEKQVGGSWTSAVEETHDFGGKLDAETRYVLRETSAPTGHAYTADVPFTVNKDGSLTFANAPETVTRDGKKIYQIKDKPIHLFAKKIDAETGEEVEGATFVLHEKGKDKDEDILDSWTTVSGEYHDFGSVLDAEKTYVLEETDAPTGFGFTTAKEFTVTKYGEIVTDVPAETDEDGAIILDEYGWKSYLIKEDEIHLIINKLDAETGEEVEGATLAVFEAKVDGTADTEKQVGGSWTSAAEETHDFGGKLDAETRYVLRETSAPTGHAYTADVPFTVNKDGSIAFENAPASVTKDGKRVYQIKDAPLHFYLNKVNLETGKAVPEETTIVIYEVGKSASDAIETWTSKGEQHDFGAKLDPDKTYVIEETSVPTGYAFAQTKTFKVNHDGSITADQKVLPANSDAGQQYAFLLQNKPLHLYTKKVDAATGEDVGGATFILHEKGKDKTLATWTTEAGRYYDFGSVLDAGKTYILEETEAPTGYGLTTVKEFTVGKYGEIRTEVPVEKSENGAIILDSYDNKNYLIKEDAIHFTVNKTDLGNGDEVEDAVIEVYEVDKDGKHVSDKPVDSWTSKKGEVHDFGPKLTNGKSYVLEETVAPMGYGITTATPFQITTDGTLKLGADLAKATSATEKDADGNAKELAGENGEPIYLIEDARIHFTVNKTDLGNGDEVENAVIEVYEVDKDGKHVSDKPVDSWTSKKGEMHDFGPKLTNGKSYVLEETVAPTGYGITTATPFQITTDGTLKLGADLAKATSATEKDADGNAKELTGENGEPIHLIED